MNGGGRGPCGASKHCTRRPVKANKGRGRRPPEPKPPEPPSSGTVVATAAVSGTAAATTNASAAAAPSTTNGATSLGETSALAPHYVPERLRRPNVGPAALLPTWRLLETSEGNGGFEEWEATLRASLVPRLSNADHDDHGWPPLRWAPPPTVHVDLYYALSNPLPRGDSIDDPPPPPPPPPPDRTTAPSSIPSEGGWNLVKYCDGWEASLWRERARVLQLFERYAQYERTLRVASIPSPTDPRVVHHQAQFDLPGIADAVPPVSPGDTVVVRSLQHYIVPRGMLPIVLPIHSSGAPPLQQSPQLELIPVELRCQVQAIVRQTVRDPDVATTALATGTTTVVHLSWTLPPWYNWMNQPAFQGPSQNFNLRFVPSLAPLLRCLTALTWLRRQPSKAMQTLLFPTDAPPLPSLDNLNDDDDDGDDAWDKPPSASTASTPLQQLQPPLPPPELNVPQRDFLRLVRRRTRHSSCHSVRPPLLLTGPAGTGKTQTLLRALLSLLRRPPSLLTEELEETDHTGRSIRILVCAPSHTAANVITRRLAQHTDVLDRSTLFRLLDPTCPLANVPADVLPYCRQRTDASTGELTVFGLPETARELLGFRVVVSTCHDAHWLYRVGLANDQLRTRRFDFQADLTRACRDAQLGVSLQGVDEAHWTHLFIDEAAQATEPETLIPLSVVYDPVPGLRKVEIALVGDPRQLSPAVYRPPDASSGTNGLEGSVGAALGFVPDLRRSWMERLLRRPDPALGGGRDDLLGPDMVQLQDWLEFSLRGTRTLAVFLTHNYRAHPALLMLPSSLFYSDKLRGAYNPKSTGAPTPSGGSWCRTLRAIEGLSPAAPILSMDLPEEGVPAAVRPAKQFDWPMHFRGVVGRDRAVTLTEGYTSDSWSNDDEALVVVEMVQTLLGEGASVDSVGVMAPFRGQVVRLRQTLRSVGLAAINVGTIEDYQSVERAVIVLSLTRATPAFVASDVRMRVGVFGQPQRSNVALTRAEHLLLVVGHPAVMAQDPVWLQFLRFCARNGLFYGDSGGTEDLLRWHPSQGIVSRPTNAAGVLQKADTDEVIISSLERSLRRTSWDRVHVCPSLPSPPPGLTRNT